MTCTGNELMESLITENEKLRALLREAHRELHRGAVIGPQCAGLQGLAQRLSASAAAAAGVAAAQPPPAAGGWAVRRRWGRRGLHGGAAAGDLPVLATAGGSGSTGCQRLILTGADQRFGDQRIGAGALHHLLLELRF